MQPWKFQIKISRREAQAGFLEGDEELAHQRRKEKQSDAKQREIKREREA